MANKQQFISNFATSLPTSQIVRGLLPTWFKVIELNHIKSVLNPHLIEKIVSPLDRSIGDKIKTFYDSISEQEVITHEEWEKAVYKLITQDENYQRLQIKMRESKGWKEVNKQIRLAPKCFHEEKIVISRCCPSCKKIEHNNHSCNKCTTSEDLKMDLNSYDYDPNFVYFVKRVCKACKIWKIQNETSAAA